MKALSSATRMGAAVMTEARVVRHQEKVCGNGIIFLRLNDAHYELVEVVEEGDGSFSWRAVEAWEQHLLIGGKGHCGHGKPDEGVEYKKANNFTKEGPRFGQLDVREGYGREDFK